MQGMAKTRQQANNFDFLTSTFNEGLQFGLVFLEDGTAIHLSCLCIKWAQAVFIPGKNAEVVLPAIVHKWFRVYGPPKFIVSD